MATKRTAVKQQMTKSEIFSEIAENCELAKKEVSAVFEELSASSSVT